MKQLIELLKPQVQHILQNHFEAEIDENKINFQSTRKGFDGEITLVCFPFAGALKMKPQDAAEKIGEQLAKDSKLVKAYNVAQGFLNLSIIESYWNSLLQAIHASKDYGKLESLQDASSLLVEYSSPNTNKPLHLGHIRNILLGYSVAEINKAAGKQVKKVQIINDRGIHICKSIYAWLQSVDRPTPESTGLKGDKLVGNFYVAFDQQYKKEQQELIEQGKSEDEAKKQAPSLLAAQDLLRKWEAGDEEVVNHWKTMNGWVYEGFDKTYTRLGVDFDKNYYESDTYLLGKKVIEEGLEKGVFFKKDDGSVWCDLTDEGLDEKLVLRADGTAVYMTQDIGTAIQRFQDFQVEKQIYTVGNEQDYHFQVLFLILAKLGYDWAKNCYHLSYGMVDLPSGKMKSREGTVVDADDLLDEMKNTAKEISEELGKLEGFSSEEKEELYEMIGQGALKYFILKVDPKKRILFNPAESIDFTGNTGPFIQYTHARIKSILRKGEVEANPENYTPQDKEIDLIKLMSTYPDTIQQAAEESSPALLANYLYDLVKSYNHFYQQIPIWSDENKDAVAFRLA